MSWLLATTGTTTVSSCADAADALEHLEVAQRHAVGPPVPGEHRGHGVHVHDGAGAGHGRDPGVQAGLGGRHAGSGPG